MAKVTIAAVSDIHFGRTPEDPEHWGEIADILLLRVVGRLNRSVKPDLTLVLGDILEDGAAPGTPDRLRRMREIVDQADSPTIVIPGNHDGDVDAFYEAFERPPAFLDVRGVRFVPFIDPQEPEYNARRTEEDLSRMAEARAGFGGPLVAVQHVPVFAPGLSDCPYNYTNASAVLAAMRRHGYRLAISGHYHEGMDTLGLTDAPCIAAPALCRPPFPFLIDVRRHQVRMPEELDLFDMHVHTQFAYCSEDMEMGRALSLARDFGLAGLAFAEHSGQFYFGEDAYWRGDWFERGVEGATMSGERLRTYALAAREADLPPAAIALEADCDAQGRPVLRPQDAEGIAFLIGAMHALGELRRPAPDAGRAAEEFLGLLRRFASSGIRVLAHPFRLFRRAGMTAPPELYEPTARLLRENGIAAEVNFHQNNPPPEFVRLCMESGVQLAFGSDAH
ncbi:MAG: metallophosphoesterase, partial [Planctomycetota bacterium]